MSDGYGENWGELVPSERRVDLALTLRQKGAPVLGILFESQRKVDEDKKCIWPCYYSSFHAALNLPRLKDPKRALPACPVYLVVFTEEESVARWAKEPTPTMPGVSFVPLVLTKASIPKFKTVEEAKKNPELAVFSVTLHVQKNEDLDLARVALQALAESRDEETVQVYTDVLLFLLSEAHRKTLEAEMESGTYVYKSDFAKKYIAQGKAEGEALGKLEGKREGKLEGEALGKAESIVALLEERKVGIKKEEKDKIIACQDLAQLDAWFKKAITAKKSSELFAQPAAKPPSTKKAAKKKH